MPLPIGLVHTFRLFYYSHESKGVPGQLSKEVSGVMHSIILLSYTRISQCYYETYTETYCSLTTHNAALYSAPEPSIKAYHSVSVFSKRMQIFPTEEEEELGQAFPAFSKGTLGCLKLDVKSVDDLESKPMICNSIWT